MFRSKPARHAVGYQYQVGRYLRKPRMISALTIVSRLVSERNAGKSPALQEAMPTRGSITRHNGR